MPLQDYYDPSEKKIKEKGLMVTVNETGEYGFVRFDNKSQFLNLKTDKDHPRYNRWKVEIVQDHGSLQPLMQGGMPLVKYLTPQEITQVGWVDPSGYGQDHPQR